MSDNSVSSGIKCRSRVSTIDEGHGINLASQLSDNDVSPLFNNFYCRSRRCLWCARNMRVRCATKMRARGASSIKHCSAADSCWLASTVSTSNRGEKPRTNVYLICSNRPTLGRIVSNSVQCSSVGCLDVFETGGRCGHCAQRIESGEMALTVFNKGEGPSPNVDCFLN